MKAILEFNLPEDKDAHTLAFKGANLFSVIWDIDQVCRGKLKHGHDFKSANEALEWVRSNIHEQLPDLYEMVE